MNLSSTYLFYDLETSGLNPAFDQILQFAAIRTDADFHELERHEFRVRLRPDVIPSPGALLATGVTTMQTLTTGLCEYDAVREIHAMMNQPGTISAGYNSLSFDDKFLRFAFYRNLLPPYTHQWQNGCRRLDLFPVTVLYWLAGSPLLTWPSLEGKPTLRLEHLSRENSLADGQAHDALVDVAATVELARRLYQDEARWADCLTLFDKTTFDDRLAHLPHYGERPCALLIHGKFGYDQQCQVPVLYLGRSNVAGVAHLWLRLDRPELAQTTLSTIAETTWVIRQKPGEPPFVHSPQSHRLSIERRAVTRNNIAWLRRQPELLTAIGHHHLTRPFDDSFVPDADAALYANGFSSSATERKCVRFHQAPLSEKVDETPQFEAETVRELAARLLSRNFGLGYRFPSYAAYEQRVRDETRPLLDYQGRSRLTPIKALTEIEAAQQKELTPLERSILLDLKQYICYQFGSHDNAG